MPLPPATQVIRLSDGMEALILEHTDTHLKQGTVINTYKLRCIDGLIQYWDDDTFAVLRIPTPQKPAEAIAPRHNDRTFT